MGSPGIPNSWPPYDTYRDCSLGICSVYCPQWCYIIFPPPPPSDSSSSAFSPVIIAVIGVLATALLLIVYYTVLSKYCRRGRGEAEVTPELEVTRDQWRVTTAGLDESLIKSIAVFKYARGDGLVETTECAVCLGEFGDGESLRLLPKCSHAFHLPCIDTWLKSHSNCPMCRANVVSISPDLPNSSVVQVSSLEIRRQSDLILVEDDRRRVRHEQIVVVTVDSDLNPKNPDEIVEKSEMGSERIEIGEMGDEKFGRSSSFDSFPWRKHQSGNEFVGNCGSELKRSVSMGEICLD